MVAMRALRATRFGSVEQPFEPSRIASFLSPGDSYLSVHGSDLADSSTSENIAQITQPSGARDDRSKHVRYVRAASLVTQWRANGTLSTATDPALYVHVHHFRRGDQPLRRTSIIGLIPVNSPEIVLTEAVAFQEREDRLRMLEATRFHADPVVALGSRTESLDTALENLGEPVFTAEESNGDRHEIFSLSVPTVAFEKLLVIEGSHRLVAAQAFQEDARERLSGRRRRGLEPVAPEAGPDEIAEEFALFEVILEDEAVFLRKSTLLAKGKSSSGLREEVENSLQTLRLSDHAPITLKDASGVSRLPDPRSAGEHPEHSVSTKSLPVSLAGHFMLERALNPLEVEINRSLSDAPKLSTENLPVGQLLIEIEGGNGELMKMQTEPMGTLPTGTLALDPPAASGLITWHFADFC